jgi:D-amino peptidase
MKLYISADMEGTSGVVHTDQTNPTHSDWQHFRKTMLAEVNAAIEGAFKGGATEVLVNDAHWNMRNLIIEDLHPEAVLLSGRPKPSSMMTGLDASFAGVFLTGQHARAGSSMANMDHTYSGPIVVGVWLNGVEVGEYGLNAALAGYYGVPVLLVTGDQTVCAQAKELLGADLETAVVKEAVGAAAAKNLHPTKAQTIIREAAERALKQKRDPFILKPPITLRLAVARSSQADQCLLMPDVKRVAPRVVELILDDYVVLFKAFEALIVLAGSSGPV